MSNGHYIPRFLTAPWEFADRRLQFFDFESGKVLTKSSRTLFALEGLNDPDVEKALDRYIETPGGALA